MKQPSHTTEVVVHKGTIKLKSGESLAQFTRALSEAGRQHVLQKLNLTPKTGSVYVVEVYSDSAIFDVVKYGSPNGTTEPEYKYYAATYKRSDTDSFEFGSLIEVERVSSWQAKPSSTQVVKRQLPPGWQGLWSNII